LSLTLTSAGKGGAGAPIHFSSTQLAGAGADDASVGTEAWVNASFITAVVSDGTASNFVTTGTTHYLKATNFGFAVPPGATITGVVMEINRASSDGMGTDSIVKLLVGGGVSGDNKANTLSMWDVDFDTFSYGSSSDLWGLALTPAIINAADFGVVISVDKSGGFEDETLKVDFIRLTIHYTV
jgi:hypothetical protein